MSEIPSPETNQPHPHFWRLQLRFLGLVEAIVFLVVVFTGMSLLARLWWVFDLTCHFIAQYFCILLVGALFLTWKKQWKSLLVVVLCLSYHVFCLAPLYWPDQTPRVPQTAPLRLLAFNVFWQQRDPQQVAEYIRRCQADLVLLQEISHAWTPVCQALGDVYPYQKGVARGDCFGLWLLSRKPFVKADLRYLNSTRIPTLIVELRHENRPLTFIGTHTLPPRDAEYARERNELLQSLSQTIRSSSSAVVLAGDLNITSWSPHWQDLLRESGLRDSRQGYGIQPTWPAGLFFLWIPLDHCLVSPGIAIHRRQIGPDLKSDHYPLLVDLSLPLDG